jgi:pyruvate carboxylase
MKMEASITATNAGTVQRIAVSDTAQVEGGDLLVVRSRPQAGGDTARERESAP